MVDLRIDTDQTRALLTQLAGLTTPNQRQTILFRIGQKLGVVMQAQVSDPPVPRREPLPAIYQRVSKVTGETYMSKFKSLKQQAFVILKAQEGDIPYTRGRGESEQLTVQLGALPFTVEKPNPQTTRISIGTNVSYAELVVGLPDEQAPYHVNHWRPLANDIFSPPSITLYQDTVLLELTAAVQAFLK